MAVCFVFECKHNSVQDTCKFFNFPKDTHQRNLWIIASRRRYRQPGESSRMCSCHFKDGNKANPPTIFKRNAGKCVEHSVPEKRRRKQPSTYDRFDLEDLSPNYCYVNLLRYDQHFEDSHIVDMDLKSSLKPHPMQSSANTLLCKKEEESATKYVEPYKLQAVAEIKPEFLDGSTSHSCFNANLNDIDEIRKNMKIEPFVSNFKEDPFDIKLLLRPVVVLEEMSPSQSDCIHSGKNVHVSKVLAKREGIVEKLKKDLQTLKQNLQIRVDTVEPEKNDIIGSAALEQKKKRTRKQNLKVDAILPKENNDNIGLAELKQKKRSQARRPKVSDTKASDWIKVEDVSDLSNKKIYYIYSGENCEELGNNATTADDKTANVADCIDVGCLMVMEDKNKRSRFRCSLCRKTYATESALKGHITRVHDKLCNECFKCGLTFDNEEKLKVHMSMSHDENKSYVKRNICPICYKRCSYRHRLEAHLTLHECPAYGCAGCKASFVELGTLKLHLPCPNVAERMPAYLCLLCQETFFIGSELRKHVQFTHCKKATIPNAYRKHYIFSQVQNTDGDDKGRFECNKCGKKFRLRESAKKHLPCFVKTCSICGKLFEKETKLRAHMGLFHNDKAVECLICNKRFDKQWKLDAHQRKFQGQCVNKVHMCGYCGLTFGSPERLMVHVTNHEKFSEHVNASLNNNEAA